MGVIKDIIKFTDRYIKDYRLKFFWYLLAGVILYLLGTIIPLIVGSFIDTFEAEISINRVVILCAVFISLCTFQMLISFCVKVEGTKICIAAANKMKAEFFLHMQKVSPLKSKIDDPAAIADRVNNECEYLIMFLCNLGMQFPGKCVGIIIIYGYLAVHSWQLAIVALCTIPIMLFFHKKTRGSVYEKSNERENARNAFFARMYEQLGQLRLVRTNAIYSFMHERIICAGNNSAKAIVEREKTAFKYSLFSKNADAFLKVFLFIFGGTSIINGTMTVGEFTVVFSYLEILSMDLSYFINVGQDAFQYKAFLDRLKEIDSLKEEEFGEEKIDAIDMIEINNMSFGYDNTYLYNGYSNKFKKGRLYCLTGDNGAGKTTLINNLLGLYIDETGGAISYNGKRIRDIDIYDARKRLFGVCEQEPDMLDDSLRNNLLYHSAENVDIDRFLDICRSLALFSEDGSEIITESVLEKNALELSGGQKQKFVLARALYKDPDVLIMDEPTSALDKNGVARLKEKLCELKKDRIIITISHDPEIIGIADEIVKIA